MTDTPYTLVFDEESFNVVSEIIFLVNKKAGFKSARDAHDHMVKTAQDVFRHDPSGRVSTAGYALSTYWDDASDTVTVRADIDGPLIGHRVLALVRLGAAAGDALRKVDINAAFDEAEDNL